MKKLTYIVDIDNTILRTVDGDYMTSKPFLNRIAKINDLYDSGHTVIYWTARGAVSGIDWRNLTTKQLDEFGCRYTVLWCDKPHYDVWIDDKAINSENYFQAGP